MREPSHIFPSHAPGNGADERLRRYVDGQMSPDELAALQADAEQDPFLKEALEGAAEIGDAGELTASVSRIRSQMRMRIAREQRNPRKEKRWMAPSSRQLWMYGGGAVAAAVVFLFAIILLQRMPEPQAPPLAENKPAEAPVAEALPVVPSKPEITGQVSEPPAQTEKVQPRSRAVSKPVAAAPAGLPAEKSAEAEATEDQFAAFPDPAPLAAADQELSRQEVLAPVRTQPVPASSPAPAAPLRVQEQDDADAVSFSAAPRAIDTYVQGERYQSYSGKRPEKISSEAKVLERETLDDAQNRLSRAVKAMQENRPAEALNDLDWVVRNTTGTDREEGLWLTYLAQTELGQQEKALRTLETIRKEKGFYASRAEILLEEAASKKQKN